MVEGLRTSLSAWFEGPRNKSQRPHAAGFGV